MSAAVLVFVVSAVACAVANVAILVSTLRPAPSDAGMAGVRRPNRAIEFAWALLPIIALAFVLTATWGHVRARETPKPAELMKVAR